MPTLGSQLAAEFAELEADPNNIVRFLMAILACANDLEAVLQALLTERNIDTAIGYQLDVLGFIVDEDRNGTTDDVYRRLIRAKILVNRSSGSFKELIVIAKLVVNDPAVTCRVTQNGYATIRIFLTNPITAGTAALLFKLERLAASGGVRLILEYSEQPAANLLIMDSAVSTQTLDTGYMTDEIGD